MKTRMAIIAQWLELVRSAYVRDGAAAKLPSPPPELTGEMIELSDLGPARPTAVERR